MSEKQIVRFELPAGIYDVLENSAKEQGLSIPQIVVNLLRVESSKEVQIALDEEVYEEVERRAEDENMTVETYIVERLKDICGENSK